MGQWHLCCTCSLDMLAPTSISTVEHIASSHTAVHHLVAHAVVQVTSFGSEPSSSSGASVKAHKALFWMADAALLGLIFRMWMYAGYLHSEQQITGLTTCSKRRRFTRRSHKLTCSSAA